MKLSYNWIKEYVDIKVSPEELAKGLTMSGSEVGSMEKTGGDAVMELEITSNRPDCLNMIGLAREVSAAFDKALKVPAMSLPASKSKSKGPAIKCVIEDKDLCSRYTARVIAGLTVKPSGKKLKKHITAVGLRPVNNIVDVTNFCLMETGQPLHAFDLDKIKGAKITVRRARKNEKIITIDGVERELKTDMLVIADAERAIAVAGVMGGRDTEVSSFTKNVLLESAYFDPISIRRTARTLGLASDSSYRFERGVDKGMVRAASDRATSLIEDEAGGEIRDFYDAGTQKEEKTIIDIDVDGVGKVLGIKIAAKEISRILSRLGMKPAKGKAGRIKVTVPTFREDIKREVDLIEEIARIYGYDRIPDDVPKFVPQVIRKEQSRKVIEKIKNALASAGLNEIMTYSLISEQAAGIFPALMHDPVKLMNPLSAEQEMLTPHLADGMLKAAAWNMNRGNKDLALFEIGKIYYRRGGKRPFGEISTLSLGMAGDVSKNWKDGAKKTDIYSVKGIAENLAGRMGLALEVAPAKVEGFTGAGNVFLGGEEAGFIGEVAKDKLSAYGIEERVVFAQIKLDAFIGKAELTAKYKPIPRFPVSSRDVSVLCEQALPAAKIKEAIEGAGEQIMISAEATDVYTGEQIPAGKKSVTFSITYGLDSRTMTDEEISAAHSRIKNILTEKLGVTFR